ISDQSTDVLNLLFNDKDTRHRLTRRFGLEEGALSFLDNVGISGIANILAAIKLAEYMGYGPTEAVMTIATDGAGLYQSELEAVDQRDSPEGISDADIDAILAAHLRQPAGEHLIETNARERRRIFNLGYYTWVEQQGVSVEDFDARRDQ